MSQNITIPAAGSSAGNGSLPSAEFLQFAQNLWNQQQRAMEEQQPAPLEQEAASTVCKFFSFCFLG
jgi:hypothetical protein